MSSRRVVLRSAGAGLLASAVDLPRPAIGSAAERNSSDVVFPNQVGGAYDGMPLFDGNPRHLGIYLDELAAYAGVDACANWANWANWANGIRGDFTIPSGPNAGKVVPGAPQFDEGQGIRAGIGNADNVSTATDGDILVLKSVSTGKYLSLGAGAEPSLSASASHRDAAASFEAFAWGQGVYSYRSLGNTNWLQFSSNAVTVGGTQRFGTSSTAIPYRWRLLNNDDGTVSFIAETYTESFGGGFETRYYTNGRYLSVNDDGSLGVTTTLTNSANAATLNTPSTRFRIETVTPAGSQTAAYKATYHRDYAVVVLGAPPRHSAGEGADRSDLYLGADQYRLAESVAATYPGKTIVVLATTTPVIVDSLQRNTNIAAIVNLPYAGQYGAYALGQVLFGDYAPTGRLNQTWYANQQPGNRCSRKP